MQKTAALRGAVFLVIPKNRRGALNTPPPPIRARVNQIGEAIYKIGSKRYIWILKSIFQHRLMKLSAAIASDHDPIGV